MNLSNVCPDGQLPVSIVTVLSLVVLLLFTGCNLADDVASPGQSCDEEGATEGTLVCEDGEWVQDDRDAGVDDAGGPDDADPGDDTGECEPETDEEFCERLQAECGQIVDNDNCGDARSVDCSQLEGFGCGELGDCLLAENHDALETNICDCPNVDFDASDEAICDELGAECDHVDPAALCVGWEDYEELNCGSCAEGEQCGLAGPNICGCHCEIDDGCQAEGDPADDDPCMVCDPDQSDTEYSPAEDGVECGANAICEDGDCVCEDGYKECDGECVDTDSHLAHCGGCDVECTTEIPGASPVCENGGCGAACDSGDETLCEDAGVCTDTDTDADHCGSCATECGANEACEDGSCVCAPGYEECDGECVDTDADHDHCGGCNQGCSDIEMCDSGTCEESCPSGETACSGACVDTDDDLQHCGGCGVECPDDVTGATPQCVEGTCGYACDDAGLTLCESEGLCTDTDTDEDHCGDCGNACDSGQYCDDGTCVDCIDDDHCSGCESCNGGDCVDNDSNCSGCESCDGASCVDDDSNCSGCQSCNDSFCSDDDGLCSGCESCDSGDCIDDDSNCSGCESCNDSDCVDNDSNCSGCESCDGASCVDDNSNCSGCESCNNASCVDDNSQCGGDDLCDNASCVDCIDDSNCSGCKSCDGGSCVDDNSNCSGCESCDDGDCVDDDNQCSGSEPLCNDATCVECISQSDCGGDCLVCTNNSCTDDDGECSGGDVCSGGQCYECTSDSHCPGSCNVCSSNSCEYDNDECSDYCCGDDSACGNQLGECVECYSVAHCDDPDPDNPCVVADCDSYQCGSTPIDCGSGMYCCVNDNGMAECTSDPVVPGSSCPNGDLEPE